MIEIYVALEFKVTIYQNKGFVLFDELVTLK